ncbi:TlyA family rRNA (cytidine-2'-O)-methyltransfera se [Desulfonema ishimotonii]|uniref:TlyA family rRNA (Cytidine-2'-O)-methyltransfera se n=1 Tax=Desulfonema ishimotonii TaxID=45657 RepID=A0A401FUQ4_9BACT|nr:TlyA family RNA methyltransferase [Desulfonema ishimotonii]GBC60690.1 TlyA family rRNA (cytidine-2'-O)-methyltransfera se [Desulfonema ishimotonii]
MAGKQRLDLRIVQEGLAQSRQRAQALIMAGKVRVNNVPVDKPGAQVSADDVIVLKGGDIPYVSRGGLKLEGALADFDIRVDGWVCLDVGASTGGFTDCLLQHGAKHVFAVDVGYGQLAWTLRQDSRVTAIERTNIRHMAEDALDCRVDLVTIDASFISLKIVVPSVLKFMKEHACILALIKPQFEVGKGKVGKGGVVRDPMLHDEVIRDLWGFSEDMGLKCRGVVPSPVLGPRGNKEFVIFLSQGETDG